MTQPLLEQAKILAQTATQHSARRGGADCLPVHAFMAVRPNSVAESLAHGQAVARVLSKWKATPQLQAAGLLHSLYCKQAISAEQIAEFCGDETAQLCRHYYDALRQTPEAPRRGKPAVIKRVKLYTAAYRNPDLAFLGVASLWDHFNYVRRTSDPNLQRAFCEEATDVMIPLLDMLGMWRPKSKVETWLKLHHISPQDHDIVLKRIAPTKAVRAQTFELVTQTLAAVLPDISLQAKPLGLAAVYNSAHPDKVNHEILQKLTVEVLAPTEPACYDTLRWIHHFWQPVEGGLVDYIGTCKINGYRCLQTTVIVKTGNSHTRVHFKICTPEMDRVNQWGIAAIQTDHLTAPAAPAWWNARAESYAQICSAPLGSLPDILYVFTPQGQLLKFSRGSTVVDYAYQVHSEVAHQTRRFKLNGEAVAPATVLRHLDLVELKRDPQFSGPTEAWLYAAHSSRARTDIDRFLKRQRRGKIHGREVIDARLRELSNHYHLDIPNQQVEQTLRQAAHRHSFESVEQLLSEVGAGQVPLEPLLHPLFSAEVVRQIETPAELHLRSQQLTLAQCCKPRPGDDIVGRPKYQNKEIVRLKVHQAACLRIAGEAGAIPLKWQLQPALNTVARLEITALAKINLLAEALAQFSPYAPDITLHTVNAVARGGAARLNFTVEAKNQLLIDAVAAKLQELPGHHINEVRQMRLTFSERQELVTTDNPAAFNPYRRQPVQDRDMFFGRTQELAYIQNSLCDGIGVVFVQGQKRVGKTSLLLYLKKYYLNRRSKVPVFIDFQLLSKLTGPAFFYEFASAVYNDLQADNQINHLVDPPLRDLFERDPARQLADYLQHVQSHFGFNKLVLLIDEFSRTIDAYQQERIDDTLFHQWRGIIQATAPRVSYVMVVQEQTFFRLQQTPNQNPLAPIWHLLELGQTISLPLLTRKDAHQLIERPTYHHLDYSPEALGYVWRLTGGSPFLIHAFCFELVRHMAHSGRRRVDADDVTAVQHEFMHPKEGIFAHLLDVIQNITHGVLVCHRLAAALHKADVAIQAHTLQAALPNLPPEALDRALRKLEAQHILTQPNPNAWQFASLLFGHWLLTNQVLD